MKKRGFTLIELLAVIVVLAIIALIATPIVMNVIKNAQKGAAERSAERYVDAVETAIATNRLEHDLIADGEYNIVDGQLEGTSLDIKVSGDYPKSGTVVIEKGQVVSSGTSMTIGDYTVTIDSTGKAIAVAKGDEPSCTIVSGNLNTYGSEVDCKGEHFYVIAQDTTNHKANSTTVSLLSKYALNVGEYVYDDGTEGMQSANLGGQATESIRDNCGINNEHYYGEVYFDEYCVYDDDTQEYVSKDTGYWSSDTYPAFVYGEESTIYPYLQTYLSNLEALGVNNIKEMTIMSYEQPGYIGCDYLNDGVYINCSNVSWLSNFQYSWLGSAIGPESLYSAPGTPNGMSNTHVLLHPVMIIDANEIK